MRVSRRTFLLGAVASPLALRQSRAAPDWFVARPRPDAIAAYLDSPSYLPGATARLACDSAGRPYRVAVYRVGDRFELVHEQSVGSNPVQPTLTIADDRPRGEKLATFAWEPSLELAIGSDWQSGAYLVRLTRDDGAESYASFVVRPAALAELTVCLSTHTWQAYNTFGGLSLYRDTRLPAGKDRDQALVAHSVTALRPYVQAYGAGDLLRYDLPLLIWLDRLGLEPSLITDRDVLGGVEIERVGLLVLSGHTEYHARSELDRYRAFVNGGGNLALFGGNGFVWQARFSADRSRMTVWRQRALDPVKGTRASIRFRDLGLDPAALTGVRPVYGPRRAFRVRAAGHWSMDGTGVTDGQPIADVLGAEFDGVPRGRVDTTVLARAGSIDLSMRQSRAGGFVFSGSQLGFNWHLAYPAWPPAAWIDASTPPGGKRDTPARTRVHPVVQRIAGNLLARGLGIENPVPRR